MLFLVEKAMIQLYMLHLYMLHLYMLIILLPDVCMMWVGDFGKVVFVIDNYDGCEVDWKA